MKTAISIPDNIFREADALAKKLGVSRSELYTKAVCAFVQEHRGEQIIETLNALYSQESSELDVELQQLQELTLASKEW
jgi:metal-responsive CopG/Arc/MetJ family transcriptional regulator